MTCIINNDRGLDNDNTVSIMMTATKMVHGKQERDEEPRPFEQVLPVVQFHLGTVKV